MTWDIAGSHDVTCDVTEPDAIDDAVRRDPHALGRPDLRHRHGRASATPGC